MRREISLFSNYHSKENTVTNYCGLLLKSLYQESPLSFENVINNMIDETPLMIGPRFEQQVKLDESIPDLSITQRSFSIYFENKLTDWFYIEQILRHIRGFDKNSDGKILFLLTSDITKLELKFEKEIKEYKEQDIAIIPISYAGLIKAIEDEKVRKSESFISILEEFKDYLDREGLLPDWQNLLDVVSCRRYLEEDIIKKNVYICPDQGGVRSHKRAKYFGPYANKCVSYIYEIKALVAIEKDLGAGEVRYINNVNKSPDVELQDYQMQLINEAKEIIKSSEYRTNENKEVPLQVFLLENGVKTNFIKDSDGGMFSSKIYFRNIAKNCDNSKELANFLMDKRWSEFK